MVTLLRALGRQHDRSVPHQVGLILRGLACQESVEIFETQASWPVLKGAGGGRFLGGCIVPLSPGGRIVAVVFQYIGHQRATLGDVARVPVPVVCQLRDLPGTDAVMIPAGQYGRPCGRAHGRSVEAVERDSSHRDAVHCPGLDFAPEGGRQAGTCVVDQHDEDVRRIRGKPAGFDARLVDRFLHRAARDARRRGRWERKRILPHYFVVRAHYFSLQKRAYEYIARPVNCH